jgi:hypothetical protein
MCVYKEARSFADQIYKDYTSWMGSHYIESYSYIDNSLYFGEPVLFTLLFKRALNQSQPMRALQATSTVVFISPSLSIKRVVVENIVPSFGSWSNV